MKCINCGGIEFRDEHRLQDYAPALGIVLKAPAHTCVACGEQYEDIPHWAALTRALAALLITRPERLDGAAIRQVRSMLELQGSELARVLGTKRETVSRWEHDKAPIGSVSERLLRMLAAAELGVPLTRTQLEQAGTKEPAKLDVVLTWDDDAQRWESDSPTAMDTAAMARALVHQAASRMADEIVEKLGAALSSR